MVGSTILISVRRNDNKETENTNMKLQHLRDSRGDAIIHKAGVRYRKTRTVEPGRGLDF